MNRLFSDDRIRRYIERESTNIPGMVTAGPMALIWSLLQAQDDLEIPGNIAEIGVYCGKLFALLSMGLRESETAYGLDLYDYDKRPAAENRERLQTAFAKLEIPHHIFKLITANSQNLDEKGMSEILGSAPVRMMSVDGDHSKNGALHDLKLAMEVVNSSGVILVDDLFNEFFPGVTEAIFSVFSQPTGGWKPIAIAAFRGPIMSGASKLIVVHESQIANYRAYLRVLNRPNFRTVRTFLGEPVMIFDYLGKVGRVDINAESRSAISQILGRKSEK